MNRFCSSISDYVLAHFSTRGTQIPLEHTQACVYMIATGPVYNRFDCKIVLFCLMVHTTYHDRVSMQPYHQPTTSLPLNYPYYHPAVNITNQPPLLPTNHPYYHSFSRVNTLPIKIYQFFSIVKNALWIDYSEPPVGHFSKNGLFFTYCEGASKAEWSD